jgi:zinc protease
VARLVCIPTVTDAAASRRLDNGLVMHALEARHAPVVSLWVWYQVGGRNEVPGTTGMSHFLEHMLFKGTPKHPKGDLDKLLARYGALWNAFTSEDVTCYFETVPAERYPVALELEADRMRNALITVEETEAERNVIVSEREGLENDPSFLLGEQLQAVAFARHPYAQGVIGSKEEIKLMTRDGLYAHYRRHYAPNNAYFIVAGDAPAEELLDRAASAFGPLDAEAPIEPPKAPEPPQYGEKRVIVRRAGGALPIIQIGHKAPRASDPRAAALSALAVALGGATAGGGEAASGRSSRFYRALVDTGLATAVDASFSLMKDPYLFIAEAHLRPGVTHEQVERVILDELDKVAKTALGDEEFGRVRRQMLSASAFMTDTVTWRAFRFGQLLATEAATSLGEWYDRLAAVTAEDVRAAAESVFHEKGRVVGWFVPENS